MKPLLHYLFNICRNGKRSRYFIFYFKRCVSNTLQNVEEFISSKISSIKYTYPNVEFPEDEKEEVSEVQKISKPASSRSSPEEVNKVQSEINPPNSPIAPKPSPTMASEDEEEESLQKFELTQKKEEVKVDEKEESQEKPVS